MRMLEANTPNQMRDLVKRSERSWPIGHGEAGVIAGDKRPGNDQQKGYARGEDRKSVMRAMIR